MKLCSIGETAKQLGYKSRSQIYRMISDGWLNDYLQESNGRKYLELEPRGKRPLKEHMAGITQWRPNGVLHSQQ